jgi:cytochrome c oxidase subunit 2
MAVVSQTAIIITVAYAIAVVIGSAISIAVWRSTTRPLEEDRTGAWSRRESTWLVVMVLVLFALLLGTIFYVPYGESAGAQKQVVRVAGVQFAWAVDAPQGIRAGTPVEFLVTAEDVNHGFGVYNPAGTLLFQAQVIPGRTQKLVHTFTQAGTYEVLCLEFCGAKHHEMITTFEVKPA